MNLLRMFPDHFTSMAALQNEFLKGVHRRFMDPTYWGLPKYSKRTTNPPSEDGGNGEESTTTGNDSENLLRNKVGEIESYYDTYISKFLSPDGELTESLFQENGIIDLLGYLNDKKIIMTYTIRVLCLVYQVLRILLLL